MASEQQGDLRLQVQHVVLDVIDTFGLLFILDATTPTATAVLETFWPQFLKRQHGWKLSIEELVYLMWLSDRNSYCNTPEALSHSPVVTVRLHGEKVCRLQGSLQRRNALSCELYRRLTVECRFKLRHGSQFGALFIGYSDVAQHGEVLFFAGPLAPLEETRASRLAGSVGKQAEVVWLANGLVRQPLVREKMSTSQQRANSEPAKKRRKASV